MSFEQRPIRVKPRSPGDDWRVILRLTSISTRSVNTENRDALTLALKKPQEIPEPTVTLDGNEYYVDLTLRGADSDEGALEQAIARTADALLATFTAAQVDAARLAPLPEVNPTMSSSEAWRVLDDVSPEARDLFEHHHEQAMGRAAMELASIFEH